MSLKHAKEVLRLELDPLDKNFPKVLSSKNAVMSSVLTATVRVNQSDLQRKTDDGIKKVLAAIEAEDAQRLV
jgi:hypothetical protein